MAKIDLGLIRGSMWYQGTKMTGQNTEGVIFPETGITEALKGDKYQNSETNDLYECIKGGAADIAQWKWYGNISFGDISDRAVTYELPETVDMLQIPASGGLLKNFVGWILKSISNLKKMFDDTSGEVKNETVLTVVEVLKTKWGTLQSETVGTTILSSGGPAFGCLYYKLRADYGIVLMLSYYVPRPIYVVLLSGVWKKPIWL